MSPFSPLFVFLVCVCVCSVSFSLYSRIASVLIFTFMSVNHMTHVHVPNATDDHISTPLLKN